MADSHCSDCVYFIDHHMMGQCRRFPLYQNRHKTEWCGEHKSPVVMTAVVTENTVTITETPKKRGRPARTLVPLILKGDVE